MGFLFTMSDATINTSTSLRILRQAYTKNVLKTIILRNFDLWDTHFNQQNILCFLPVPNLPRLTTSKFSNYLTYDVKDAKSTTDYHRIRRFLPCL